MILEGKESGMWCDDQSVASTATTITSTNVLDLATAYKGEGEPKDILIQMTETFASGGAATLQVKLISDTEAAFGDSPQTDWDSGAIALASLVAGYKFKIDKLPDGMKRYAKLSLIVGTTTSTAGKVTAGLVGEANDGQAKWPTMNSVG